MKQRAKTDAQEVPPEYEKELPNHESDHALEQSAQRDCGVFLIGVNVKERCECTDNVRSDDSSADRPSNCIWWGKPGSAVIVKGLDFSGEDELLRSGLHLGI
ncbi:hypothetical protein WISP_65280 [Willisornis vidua]|uniref:TDRD3 protein n=1 Tax=Willisornis vidua TaxID=1566151 RepID=A0ABQ9DEV6_9PASS|nr:hypothetical protein WISP_65280 [Willisornis vidua]